MQNDILTKFLEYHYELDQRESETFEKFLQLFLEYNSHTNLSAIRDPAGVIEKHFIDSVMSAPIIHGLFDTENTALRLIDIWSGWGFPGIPLKIVMPTLDITLLDSVGKKTHAQNFFIEQLGFGGIRGIKERAEVLGKHPDHHKKYHIVTSRATAFMTDILTWATNFLHPDGKIILYKMPSAEESQTLPKLTKKLGIRLLSQETYTLQWNTRTLFIFGK
jgi:16S rRNA (guanine527-N7)-methyltransferase